MGSRRHHSQGRKPVVCTEWERVPNFIASLNLHVHFQLSFLVLPLADSLTCQSASFEVFLVVLPLSDSHKACKSARSCHTHGMCAGFPLCGPKAAKAGAAAWMVLAACRRTSREKMTLHCIRATNSSTPKGERAACRLSAVPLGASSWAGLCASIYPSIRPKHLNIEHVPADDSRIPYSVSCLLL